LIPIGCVDRVRGLRGEVVVTVYADDPSRMAEISTVYVMEGESSRVAMAVQGVKRLGDRAVLKLSGIETPEQAGGLKGRELFIPRAASTPAPAGRYYAYQLAGLTVRLRDGRVLGRVHEVLRQASQSLLVVHGIEGEFMVPMVRAICVEIDLTSGTLTIDPPEGLIELNAPRGGKD
jgi:16S rRNA processing protein RimM